MLTTRFAPSPTGPLHLGHAYSAVQAHRVARENDGRFLLRIEDLDQTRSRAEFVDGIVEDLRWLGLDWDGDPVVQSTRTDAYRAALDRLRDMGLVYACFCSRGDIAAALSAPHARPDHYPGTCRALPDNPERRARDPHSWRLNAGKALARVPPPAWTDNDRTLHASADDFDDEILARKDAPAAYHLACVVDDAASGVNLVVRGMDLRASTPVQRLLQILLGLPEPAYFHHRLVLTDDGRRLAKRDRAPTLAALRDTGVDGPALAEDLRTGLVPSGFRLAVA
ncbi:tRNA glutamyl-Q(34) synthetase GluQRS [Sphingomonas sabuli]|uniref:tRNA glutamyl-Q(34) synthetase GluQRS n=1 Tax=Sphingomonas sabuli TaxID=2764186 RepID=A0A7G9KZH9_9SPHN|nr:tRNA glutamyl-Q(34) synthetase GluQRS [Sphingomonas sabuli]QNM81778.1 tRNA glutamyl-Q(34) synthetase GluQRS [Sphingomonas sabuli]